MTICNQNTFRITEVVQWSDGDLYKFIDTVFGVKNPSSKYLYVARKSGAYDRAVTSFPDNSSAENLNSVLGIRRCFDFALRLSWILDPGIVTYLFVGYLL